MKKGAERLPYGEGRSALVDASIRLVAREGLHRLTYRSLTAEAGVTQGSLRHHFPHLVAVLEAGLEQCVAVSAAYASRPIDKIDDLLVHMIDLMREQPDVLGFLAEVFVAARHRPELYALALRHQETYRVRVREAVEAAGASMDDSLIDLIVAVGDGIVFQRVVFGEAWAPVTERQVSGSGRLLSLLASASAETARPA